MAEYVVATGARMYAVSVRPEGEQFRVAIDGDEAAVVLEHWLGSTHYRLSTGGTVARVGLRRHGDAWLVSIDEEQYRLQVATRLPIPRRSLRGAPAGVRDVTAPMPGLIVAVEVAPGDVVDAGRTLVIIEAMKMQSEIRAPAGGRITALRVRPGEEVMGGAVLVTLEATR